MGETHSSPGTVNALSGSNLAAAFWLLQPPAAWHHHPDPYGATSARYSLLLPFCGPRLIGLGVAQASNHCSPRGGATSRVPARALLVAVRHAMAEAGSGAGAGGETQGTARWRSAVGGTDRSRISQIRR